MEITKVIVDKLPEACFVCEFCYDTVGVCNLAMRELVYPDYKEIRPDWCPLVTTDELFEGNVLSELYRKESEVE